MCTTCNCCNAGSGASNKTPIIFVIGDVANTPPVGDNEYRNIRLKDNPNWVLQKNAVGTLVPGKDIDILPEGGWKLKGSAQFTNGEVYTHTFF